jgi:hypothetical protein
MIAPNFKTRCARCMNWIVWSHELGAWYHLESDQVHCLYSGDVATRDPHLPLFPVDGPRRGAGGHAQAAG